MRVPSGITFGSTATIPGPTGRPLGAGLRALRRGHLLLGAEPVGIRRALGAPRGQRGLAVRGLTLEPVDLRAPPLKRAGEPGNPGARARGLVDDADRGARRSVE